MAFLTMLGKVARSAGRTIGRAGGVVRSIANNSVTRTVADAVGSAGKALLPLAAPLIASNPEFAPLAGAVGKGLTSLQNGSALNRVAGLAGDAQKIGRSVNRFGSALV